MTLWDGGERKGLPGLRGQSLFSCVAREANIVMGLVVQRAFVNRCAGCAGAVLVTG